MAKHAKKKRIEVSALKCIIGLVALIALGFCVGGVIAYVVTSGMPTRLLMT